MLHFQCPSCKTQCEAAPEFAGKLVVCPHCAHSVSVPKDAAAITADAPPLPAPPRSEADADPWRGKSILKDGGAPRAWLEMAVFGLIGLGVIAILFALCIPTRSIQEASPRIQSINNLKNIGLAMHSFHDTHKRLPFNGSDVTPADAKAKYTKEARPGSFTSGSWAFQILPFIDQAPLFNQPDPAPQAGISVFMCPKRERPRVEDKRGPWTDYFYNNYLNDPMQAANPNAPDARRTLVSITDGTANTIFVGEGNISTRQYTDTANVIGSTNILLGGTFGTMRSGNNGKANPIGATLQRDSRVEPSIGSWGGPHPQGGLMCMGDATVRMFPYGMDNFSAFLTPTGGENVELPDT